MVSKRVQTLLEQLRAQGIRDEHVLHALDVGLRNRLALPDGQRHVFPRFVFKRLIYKFLTRNLGERVKHMLVADPLCAKLFQNDFAALHGGAHDGAAGAHPRLPRAGDWHRVRVSDCDSGASGASCVLG